MAESVSQRDFYGNQGMHYMASQATTGDTDEDLFHDAHLQLQEHMRNPIAFHAEMMGDFMYLQQVLKQPNAKEFVQAVIKEVHGHMDSNNWTLQKRSNVPEDVQIVPSVWSLQRKHDLTTNKVKSHKARLNLHGGKQVYRMSYFETYAPVVTWFVISMVPHQAYDHLWNHFLLGPSISGLCYGLSTSSNQDGHLHGGTRRDSNQAWELQRIRFEAREEYLLPKTGWACVEFIPCGQTHVHRIHNDTDR